VRVEGVAGPGRPVTVKVQGAAERAGQVTLTGEGVVMVVGQDADDRGGLGQHRPVFGAGEKSAGPCRPCLAGGSAATPPTVSLGGCASQARASRW